MDTSATTDPQTPPTRTVYRPVPTSPETSTGVRTLRDILRLNQTDFGLILGYETAQISRFERGKWPVTLEVIRKLIPLLSKAQEQIDNDQIALDSLKRLYESIVVKSEWIADGDEDAGG